MFIVCCLLKGLVPVDINPKVMPQLYENVMVVGYPLVSTLLLLLLLLLVLLLLFTTHAYLRVVTIFV